ncbi:hypothetical protein GCM10009779_16880 [Polymorphospora rubra]|uniref:Uncharacterized protein n=1 Tax=Polymorphospora rubra TaxID=338584 RepID=A0A810N401_9ACTN|nr:hypothetical protein Prubr_50780 [Polymorphospora rubra]
MEAVRTLLTQTDAELADLPAPANYLGAAELLVDAVPTHYRDGSRR